MHVGSRSKSKEGGSTECPSVCGASSVPSSSPIVGLLEDHASMRKHQKIQSVGLDHLHTRVSRLTIPTLGGKPFHFDVDTKAILQRPSIPTESLHIG